MLVTSVLVVCVGNICRSPLGAKLLSQRLDARGAQISVSSAGIAALVGHGADQDAATVAENKGVDLTGHVARQFAHSIGASHSLILVMESGHKHEITKTFQDLSGKIMLFDHWTGARGIADPYRRSVQFHEEVFLQIDAAANAWASKLAK